jgi:hypothetical protein
VLSTRELTETEISELNVLPGSTRDYIEAYSVPDWDHRHLQESTKAGILVYSTDIPTSDPPDPPDLADRPGRCDDTYAASPKYTFSNTLEEQKKRLANNPLVAHYRACREEDKKAPYYLCFC